jgi:hypothetical protein
MCFQIVNKGHAIETTGGIALQKFLPDKVTCYWGKDISKDSNMSWSADCIDLYSQPNNISNQVCNSLVAPIVSTTMASPQVALSSNGRAVLSSLKDAGRKFGEPDWTLFHRQSRHSAHCPLASGRMLPNKCCNDCQETMVRALKSALVASIILKDGCFWTSSKNLQLPPDLEATLYAPAASTAKSRFFNAYARVVRDHLETSFNVRTPKSNRKHKRSKACCASAEPMCISLTKASFFQDMGNMKLAFVKGEPALISGISDDASGKIKAPCSGVDGAACWVHACPAYG